jgi:cohesin complex subunit SCC1
MFYSKYMFVKKGPLSKVWIAAHFHRKLTKPHVQGTDINLSAKTILDPNTPLALRLSGQLLLGLVRIYQRKVKYLLEDCSDALSKMKMIFRPGVVDLPAESAAAPSAAITYADDAEALEYDIPDIPLDNLDEFIAGQDLDQTVAASFDSFSALSGKRNDLTMAADDITLSAFEQDEMDLFAAPDLLEELPADGASIFEDSIEVGRDAGELTALPDFDFDIKADDLAASGRKSDASKRESFLSMGGEFSGLETTDAEGGGFMDGDGDRLSMASGREPPTPVPGFVDEAAERAQAAEVAAATKERKAAQKRKRKAGRKDADTELKSEAIRKHLQDTEELQTERGTVPLAKRAKYDNHWKKVGVRTLLNRPSGLSRSMFDMVEDDALPCNPALLKLFSRTAKLGRAAVPLAEGVEEVEEEGVVAMEEEEGKEEAKRNCSPWSSRATSCLRVAWRAFPPLTTAQLPLAAFLCSRHP